jgi:structural maintenance of chromosome 3 (chondroitin sulfate proteoglycan 6)
MIVLDQSIEELGQKMRDGEGLLASTRVEQEKDQRSIQDLQKNVERYLSKRSLLMQKREERAQKIRELGALPEGAFEAYQGYSSKKVYLAIAI